MHASLLSSCCTNTMPARAYFSYPSMSNVQRPQMHRQQVALFEQKVQTNAFDRHPPPPVAHLACVHPIDCSYRTNRTKRAAPQRVPCHKRDSAFLRLLISVTKPEVLSRSSILHFPLFHMIASSRPHRRGRCVATSCAREVTPPTSPASYDRMESRMVTSSPNKTCECRRVMGMLFR